MKKVLATGILAICLIAMSQQQASAWVKWNIGVGANLGWQSGGNSFLWGAYRGGQPTGPEFYGYHGHHFHHHGHAEAPFYAPQPIAPANAQPAYIQPGASYAPFQYATYPRPVYYYYPTPYYYGR